MRTYILLLFTSGLLSYLLTLWISRLAAERGWARREGDATDGDGTPRLGGLAVLAAILLAMGGLLTHRNMVTDRVMAEGLRGVALLAACLVVFLLGVYDDLRAARPWQKLAIQAMAAGLLFTVGFRVEILSNPFTHTPVALGWLALPLTVVWLVAISNAFNLIDGLDGLAAGVGLFAAVALFLLAALVSNVFVAATAAAIAGALLGFLPHNFHPARIYLGDSGSLTAGMALAALSIASSQKGPVMVAVAIPLLIFGLPLLEVAVTTSRRLLSGHPLFRRDEDHLHHRLIKIGVAKRFAVFVLYGLAALFALSSILLVNYSGTVAPLVAVLCGALAWMVVGQMQYPEFAELDAHIRLALRSQARVLRNQIAIRKAAGAMAAADSAADLWQSLTALLEQLGFEEATCEFSSANGRALIAYCWKCSAAPPVNGNGNAPGNGNGIGQAHSSAPFWSLEIPLAGEAAAAGLVRLRRAFDQGTLLFRLHSLVELISLRFSATLAGLARREAPTPAPPLAAALRAAAGIRR
jgi:UDP-GlcNAc:undecaprenyl-phosphate GlcNAc-1-phosphate transferase